MDIACTDLVLLNNYLYTDILSTTLSFLNNYTVFLGILFRERTLSAGVRPKIMSTTQFHSDMIAWILESEEFGRMLSGEPPLSTNLEMFMFHFH